MIDNWQLYRFSASTALAAIELSNRAVMMFHTMAETMYDMLSPGPALQHRQRRLTHATASQAAGGTAVVRAQPADFREGVTNAYQVCLNAYSYCLKLQLQFKCIQSCWIGVVVDVRRRSSHIYGNFAMG